MNDSYEANGEIDFIDLGYKGLSILYALKKPLLYFFIFTIIIGFISTAVIQPKFEASTRILFKLPNENLKNEKNIDFSSLSKSAIKTEIEIMLSNALLHNVIKNKNISKPTYEISRDNSSIITRFANLIYQYTGFKYITGLILEKILALGIASGYLIFFKIDRVILCFGNLIATDFNLAHAEGSIFEFNFLFKINVIGPGQNSLYNFIKLSFTTTSFKICL